MTTEERPNPRHLGVATDFTPGAAAAVRRAIALPLQPGATVSLLHVVSEPVPPRYLEPVLEHARGLLANVAAGARRAVTEHGYTGIEVEHDVVVGTPFVEIIRYARSRGADLVLVGRHGARAARDTFVGSTAERVIRKGDVPVLLVNDTTIAPYGRARGALDLSPDGEEHQGGDAHRRERLVVFVAIGMARAAGRAASLTPTSATTLPAA
jgi:nucleotide-binding universal stress UspA family protein